MPKEEIKKLLHSALVPIHDKLKNPFIKNYFFSFILVNSKILILSITEDVVLNERFNSIYDELTIGSYLWPLLITVLWIVLSEQMSLFIEWIQSFPLRKRITLRSVFESKRLDDEYLARCKGAELKLIDDGKYPEALSLKKERENNENIFIESEIRNEYNKIIADLKDLHFIEINNLKEKYFEQTTNLQDQIEKLKNTISTFSTENSKHLILIVDDNVLNSLIIKKIVEKMGYRIASVENGKKAVEYVEENDVSLILMDTQMPVMNGVDSTLLIRKFNSTVPIIALSANADKEKCLNAGMTDYLSKPISVTEITQVISENLLYNN